VAITDTGLIKDPGIREVRFFAMPNVYTEWSAPAAENEIPFMLIGTSRKAPYDLIWDLKGVTDMFYGYGRLYAEVEDNLGNKYRIDPEACVQFSVDRNQAVKELRISSFYTKKGPFKDEGRKSRFDDLAATLVKGNNEIKFLSLWDKRNLYFWIKVKDEFLFADFDTSRREVLFKDTKKSYRMLWLGDCIELCFDPLTWKSLGVKPERGAGLSQSYFSTQFKNEIGRAASHYLTQIRIEKACHLLIETTKSITDIAFEVDSNQITLIFQQDYKANSAHLFNLSVPHPLSQGIDYPRQHGK